jgi:hypothetical protein
MTDTYVTPPGPPNLGYVITTADVSTKGTGNYTADYVSWARVAHLLHCHAPGWEFHLKPAPDGGHCWRAPNGTAYVVGWFSGPDGQTTPHFPQAVMDNRNAAIAFDRVSARDLTDAHRRCMCTAACATFGLAWQLWAKEPVEDPHRPVESTSPDLVAAASARCISSGLTHDGLLALASELSDGSSTNLADLPAEILQRLIKAGVSDVTRDRVNAAGDAMTTPADDEAPAAWAAAA